MSRFIFSLVMILAWGGLKAQQSADTLSTSKKTFEDYMPTMIQFGYNVIPLINTTFFNGITSQNGQVGIDFANNLLFVDFGAQKTIREGDSYNYTNEGTFYRIGIETNVLKNRSDANGLTLGLRYARSRFSDQMQISDDFGFGPVTLDQSNSAVKSGWLELTLGLNVRVYKQIYFGYLVRYKVYKSNNGVGMLIPYDLPGFGKNENDSTVGFDYYVRWVLPFGKEE